MAITNAMAEVGRTCFPGQHPEFQTALHEVTREIDAYVMRNAPVTAADLERFKRENALVGAPRAFLCEGDPADMYRRAANLGAANVREQTALILSHEGAPIWGDCL